MPLMDVDYLRALRFFLLLGGVILIIGKVIILYFLSDNLTFEYINYW